MEYRLFLDQAALGEPARSALATLERHTTQLAGDEVTEVPHVLDIVRADLEADGWACSAGRRWTSGIVLKTPTGRGILTDAWHPRGVALWVETGRSWTNFAFLQHAVEAVLIPDVVDVIIAVRGRWKGQSTFENCASFLNEVFASGRIRFPYQTLALAGF